MISMKEKYNNEVVPKMTKEFGYKSPMAVPRVLKVVVNSGTGKNRDKKDAIEIVIKHLALITGQKTSPRPTKKAIASFKTREGMVIGYMATLRGQRMYDFLDRMVNLAIPRMRDFRGIPLRSIDQGGNLSLGMREHIVFPEMIGEDVRSIFGFEVTVVTSAKSKKEAAELFRLLGFPLQR
ncbi:MAG: 50S ribosomal protein L5 [Candidatus Giovannonibacteria bacterium GW2011_GWA2_44_13b]|uniref:Large ribosomal subunit protein uL5 n=2 Tax=Candidatus Giovannoniibacteriota TaxID=1752738 RepID=A0A0G1H205_9BACT|nr:MAG: 50S ribosomal protein L5 [Candidatus Giovannonibacteria bacterium GW2011_GWA2_44_13b]OGF82670.1 MAG: 50S ribosomal protein L5 [Candidatus Giovannonibacteria bacterium RIFCSPLOWO2_01_FULL_44_16]